MEYVIAVFETRNNALKFYNVLRSKRFDVYVISTPKIKNLACGISIKIKKGDYFLVKNLLLPYNIGDFLGFYEIKKQNGELIANKI